METERRRSHRKAPVLAPFGYRVEMLPPEAAARHADDWRDLAARAIETNPFYDPAFLLPALRHLPNGAGVRIVVARRNVDGVWRLVGLCPIVAPGGGRLASAARGWRDPLTALGAPLLDRRFYKGAFDAMLHWLAQDYPRAAALNLPMVRLDGELARMLRGRSQRLGGPLKVFDAHERAVLGPEASSAVGLSAKAQRNLARLRRRLGERGAVGLDIAASAADIGPAFERFLALEAGGWKAGRGALAHDPRLAAFAREAIAAFAAQGACRIFSLTLDGAPIAMGIVLASGGAAAFWKTAYDESFATFSPGVMLAAALTDSLARETTFAHVDSCAAADHPMIDRLWKRRMRVGDAMIATRPRVTPSWRVVDLGEQTRRALRGWAKHAFRRFAESRRRRPFKQ
jgi:CelD/BcsL family acetyltransferase involved in cellulose biosynthesis